MSIRFPRRLPRGIKKNDPRIYYFAETDEEAEAKVRTCKREPGKLNLLLRGAAYHNDLLTARAALEAGADPNSQNLLGESPMESLCAKGGTEMLRLFLKHGASLGPDQFGVPPLFHAVNESRKELVSAMVKAGADVNGHENLVLDTPLHIAAKYGNADMVKLLLGLGADPREVNAGGEGAVAAARSMQAMFGGISPEVFGLLDSAMKRWKHKPPPKKPRRRPKSELRRLAEETIHKDP
jgi:hypothetical protein